MNRILLRLLVPAMTVALFWGALVSMVPIWALDKSQLQEVNVANKAGCIEYYLIDGKNYCSTKNSQVSTAKIPPDKMILKFDNRSWQAAWGKAQPGNVMIEYVLKGDSIDHWKELVTSQFYANLQQKASPLMLAESQIQEMKQRGFNPNITFHTKNSTEVIYEFKVASPAAWQQDELQRIFVGKDGMYVVHYVIKKPDMGSAARTQWLGLLKAARPKI